jgi:tRNA pseudouridine synthase 10
VVFTASGREDIDVKCLGKGRPFILEFFFPKKTQFTKFELKHYTKVRFIKI